LVTGKNPLAKERGMDFHFDVVDWVGGYPYEYASIDELTRLCEPLDLSLVRANAATVPTGCNEFVFRKRSDHNAVQDHPE
jgi:2-polyprenyl-6-hydroxyphenyl methylase/3-demethylubiquinone-9 3-methyltransferase